MLDAIYCKNFKKDVKRLKKRGKDLNQLGCVIDILLNKKLLPKQYKDHILIGNYNHHRECHIEPDWIMIYKIDTHSLILERTGSHSDLFK